MSAWTLVAVGFVSVCLVSALWAYTAEVRHIERERRERAHIERSHVRIVRVPYDQGERNECND